ncbi:hypothetical protein D3C76_1126050 [compost metagenome]
MFKLFGALWQAFQLVFKIQALNAQIGHGAVQLPGFWHFWQDGDLGAQGFPQRSRGAQPLGLLNDGAQRLAYLQRLCGSLALLGRDQIHLLRLIVQCSRKFTVDLQLLAQAGG